LKLDVSKTLLVCGKVEIQQLSANLHHRTGSTGYIGGSVFATLVDRHPEYDITVLLRKPTADFSARFPDVKIIKGDYDSHDIIANAAEEAGIVVRKHNSEPKAK
jgi:hypothetical protein